MKINSNTIKLEKETYEQLEEIVKKIASENKIENVSGVEIKFSENNGIIKFAIIDDWADDEEEFKMPEKDESDNWDSWETNSVYDWVMNDESLYITVQNYSPHYTPEIAEELIRKIMPNGTPDMKSAEEYEKVNWAILAEAFNE